jgi:hypothetical protein
MVSMMMILMVIIVMMVCGDGGVGDGDDVVNIVLLVSDLL